MGVDIFTSRRKMFEPCKWWSRNLDEEIDEDEFIYKRAPSGVFYADEYIPETLDNNIVGGSFLIDRTSVTLKTLDNCDGLKNNDLVLYQGEKWMVNSVQKKHLRSANLEFSPDRYTSHEWIIQLRK